MSEIATLPLSTTIRQPDIVSKPEGSYNLLICRSRFVCPIRKHAQPRTEQPPRQRLRHVSHPLRLRKLAAVCSAENRASRHRERIGGIPRNARAQLERHRSFAANSRRHTDSLTCESVKIWNALPWPNGCGSPSMF